MLRPLNNARKLKVFLQYGKFLEIAKIWFYIYLGFPSKEKCLASIFYLLLCKVAGYLLFPKLYFLVVLQVS